MRRLAFTAAAVLAAVSAAAGLAAAPATAQISTHVVVPAGVRAATCGSDGIATMCVSTYPSQDSTAINYQVTQLDGPGTYSVTNTNTASGLTSVAQTVGPLANQAVGTGTFYAQLQQCYNVTLVSTPGTSLTVGPVCG